MAGILYGIGVGPGDPELMTLKAVRLIRECSRILVPGQDFRESVAYRIAVQAVPELADKPCTGVPMPMTRDLAERERAHRAAAERIMGWLKQGERVGFLNLGDVTIYASYLYIHRLVKAQGYEAELVNGVPSFCAAAARLGMGLCENEEQLHILPQPEQIREGLRLPGTKVIMKTGKQMEQVKQWLLESGQDVAMVERCGMEGERICLTAGDIDGKAGYYSLLIAKEK